MPTFPMPYRWSHGYCDMLRTYRTLAEVLGLYQSPENYRIIEHQLRRDWRALLPRRAVSWGYI
jgi:hypothetical protein